MGWPRSSFAAFGWRALVVVALFGCGAAKHASKAGAKPGSAKGGGAAPAGSAGSSTPESGGGGAATAGATGSTGSGRDAAVDAAPGDASGGAPSSGDAAIIDGGGVSDTSAAGAPIDPPVASGCVTDVTRGSHEFSCDGTTHVVTVSEECTHVACGVIVDVHGGSMSADMEDKNTNMRVLGPMHGYIVIQPNASPNALLAGERIFVAGMDDDRVMHILMDVIAAFHVDQNRIHMMGFSEGGFMTWRWICGHSDLLASAAPAAAGWNCTVLPITEEIGCQFSGTDIPKHHIPTLYMQGNKDMLMDPQCVFSWLTANVYPALSLDQGSKIAGDSTFERTRFLDPDKVPFELIRHDYSTDATFFGVAVGGHCYPGSTDLTVTLPGQLMGFGCKDMCSFTWAEEAVRFFMEHPKR